MTKKGKVRLGVCIFLFFLFSAYFFYRDATTTQTILYDPSEMILGEDFAELNLNREEDGFFNYCGKADGHTGTFAEIGPFYLQPGTYDFIVSYQTDSDENVAELMSDEEMDDSGNAGVVYSSAVLEHDKSGVRLSVTLTKDVNCAMIRILYRGGNLKLGYTNVEVRDGNHNFLISYLLVMAAVALFAYLFFVRYRGKQNRTSRMTLLLMTALIFYLCVPLMNDFLMVEQDRLFHLSRVRGIYTAMRDGQVPMWLNMVQLKGDGYATPIMYPQLFLYIPALLELAGMDLLHAYKFSSCPLETLI